MFNFLYIEKHLADHPRVQKICKYFPNATKIYCERYSELFNHKKQNFRLQKQKQALILAEKHDNFVLPSPINCTIGREKNYYFSHMLNCIYDCRYCFLRGMYRSANLLLFVNYEEFQNSIATFAGEKTCFFTGYDCDSLALEGITHFVEWFLPFFAQYSSSLFELRTKSANIAPLLNHDPLQNCVVAFSLAPDSIVNSFELRTPPLNQRIKAIQKLQKKGWNIGLRFDPIILCKDYKTLYRDFFSSLFKEIQNVHSITFGPMRMPKEVHKEIEKLYSDDPLFVAGLVEKNNMVSYRNEAESEMIDFCYNELKKYVSEEKVFSHE